VTSQGASRPSNLMAKVVFQAPFSLGTIRKCFVYRKESIGARTSFERKIFLVRRPNRLIMPSSYSFKSQSENCDVRARMRIFKFEAIPLIKWRNIYTFVFIFGGKTVNKHSAGKVHYKENPAMFSVKQIV
jgi:hypothetical protein